MRRIQSKFPQWWLDLDITDRQRQQVQASFTIHRDGYVRSFQGRALFVCGKATPVAEIDAHWQRRTAPAKDLIVVDGIRYYRAALSEYLAVQEARIGAKRKPISDRTYHNVAYELNKFGKFSAGGPAIGDTDIRDIGPAHFSAFARTFSDWRSSGFDSVVSRVGAFFRWAIEMEYIDRWRAGPDFVRPQRQIIRGERLEISKTFTPEQFRALYVIANDSMKIWMALGLVAAFTNSDIAHFTRSVVDLVSGAIDFRRRKTGKVRRVIPLPADVVVMLAKFNRPEPRDPKWDDLFFITRHGNPLGRSVNRAGEFKPSDSIARLFAKLDAGLPEPTGKTFTGLRTTFYNSAPAGHDLERAIIMGRAQGTVDLDSYLEGLPLERLRFVVDHVWAQFKPNT